MLEVNEDSIKLREEVFAYARKRLEYDPAPLDGPQSPSWLREKAGITISEQGLGGSQALEIFSEILAPATISTDHPNYLSFIPSAPTEASKLFDLIVSASAIYGGSWMEGAGAVFAENEVLSWFAQEAGLPKSAGGVFVQGGTLGNLSALVAARNSASQRLVESGKELPSKWKFICSAEAHSSLKSAAAVMDVEIIKANVDETGHLTGASVSQALAAAGDGVFAIVATAGTTNFGIVDRIDEIAQVANENQIWFHVDGAYGLAGILSPDSKHLFIGVEKADSLIVDPHKWLFAPFDACALIYRNPELARQAHTQHGEYLETLTESGDWNPSDYAYNLTRRPRGLPLWFSLATHGVAAYREGVKKNISLAKEIADVIRSRPDLELVREPELSVVVFTKADWSLRDYDAWSNKLLARGQAFVVPSSHKGKPNARFAIVNPRTQLKALIEILDSMDEEG
ncbi:pyridoxal phosphate-dependent decarboxylase family protein [Rhodoluna lacicola]|uniref:Glutamate decarboxylase-related PLP-dependent protein n=1 Tax=Rhodoluna lacicola TaxID=529884 RepID=A0A060JM88_9MICO|nr:aminotransferase class V-fold PLP-dependent enzyme [Rhodoluna lacicola]AIC47374.1 Glutamate decarboxylase-related PLP-dependent protein [Rhodoluna lacicola]